MYVKSIAGNMRMGLRDFTRSSLKFVLYHTVVFYSLTELFTGNMRMSLRHFTRSSCLRLRGALAVRSLVAIRNIEWFAF